MATVTMKELLEAGVHFGHQVRRWNPKMKEYIFGERNGIYIIDLQKTQKLFRDALNYVTESLTERPKQKVLFVGTKRQAQDAIKEEAERCGTVLRQQPLARRPFDELPDRSEIDPEDSKTSKRCAKTAVSRCSPRKSVFRLDREHEGLMKNLAGIKDMNGMPDMMFVIDVRKGRYRDQGSQSSRHPDRRGCRYKLLARGHRPCYSRATTMHFAPFGCLPRESRMRSSKAQQVGTEGGAAVAEADEAQRKHRPTETATPETAAASLRVPSS